MLGIPFGLTIETIPTHLSLPAKIRAEPLDPIHLDNDPERVNDREYVNSIFLQVESAIQHGMDRLAKQRRFPIFGYPRVEELGRVADGRAAAHVPASESRPAELQASTCQRQSDGDGADACFGYTRRSKGRVCCTREMR